VVGKFINNSRLAFTMIELIFAIVIIAISVLSLPMMMQVTQKGIESSLVQEAIFAASAELMGASAGYWDENSMEDIDISYIARVIDIASSPCDNNISSDRYRLRVGHIQQPYHRRCLDSNSTSASNSSGGTVISLNDSVKNKVNIFIDNTNDASGYKTTYISELNVTQSSSDADIKLIEANIYDDDNSTLLVKLRMQSANIGEIDYYKRTMP